MSTRSLEFHLTVVAIDGRSGVRQFFVILVRVPADKPRILQDNRDMLFTMLPLVVIILLLAALAGQCSFNPGGPEPGPPPQFNAELALEYDATVVDFPIRVPDVSDEWTANSGMRGESEDGGPGIVTWVGYVTDDSLYLRYSQADMSEEELVGYHTGDPAAPEDSDTAGGTDWRIYRAANGEPIWVTDLGDVRIGMTGSATRAQFTDMASKIMEAEPLS
nr:DUF4245 domain-containing protein [Hoyosella altamirensis]